MRPHHPCSTPRLTAVDATGRTSAAVTAPKGAAPHAPAATGASADSAPAGEGFGAVGRSRMHTSKRMNIPGGGGMRRNPLALLRAFHFPVRG